MTPEPTSAPAAGVRSTDVGDGGHDQYYGFDRPELRRHLPPTVTRVLDVGCGAGAMGIAIKAETGAEVVGVELFEEAAALAAEHLDAVLCEDLQTLRELPYPDGHFDAMMFGDVLEHLHDPHGLLNAFRRYLSDDGVIVISVPNVKHWTVVFELLVRDRWQYADSGLLDRTHVHFFTLEELSAMLDDTGFEAFALQPTHIHEVPRELYPLARFAAQFGEEENEVLQRLNAYQYVVAARKRS